MVGQRLAVMIVIGQPLWFVMVENYRTRWRRTRSRREEHPPGISAVVICDWSTFGGGDWSLVVGRMWSVVIGQRLAVVIIQPMGCDD